MEAWDGQAVGLCGRPGKWEWRVHGTGDSRQPCSSAQAACPVQAFSGTRPAGARGRAAKGSGPPSMSRAPCGGLPREPRHSAVPSVPPPPPRATGSSLTQGQRDSLGHRLRPTDEPHLPCQTLSGELREGVSQHRPQTCLSRAPRSGSGLGDHRHSPPTLRPSPGEPPAHPCSWEDTGEDGRLRAGFELQSAVCLSPEAPTPPRSSRRVK